VLFVLFVRSFSAHSFCCRRKDHPRAAVLASWLVLVSPRAVSPNCWRASGRVDSEHALFLLRLFPFRLVLFVVCLLFVCCGKGGNLWQVRVARGEWCLFFFSLWWRGCVVPSLAFWTDGCLLCFGPASLFGSGWGVYLQCSCGVFGSGPVCWVFR